MTRIKVYIIIMATTWSGVWHSIVDINLIQVASSLRPWVWTLDGISWTSWASIEILWKQSIDKVLQGSFCSPQLSLPIFFPNKMAHPVLWPKKTFFYPIGNTAPSCFTRDLAPEIGADVLLLGCGDPRSILYTIHSDHCPCKICLISQIYLF